jgi:TetR/AcrR family transcriptional regulator, transcriptional repressor for nem operon
VPRVSVKEQLVATAEEIFRVRGFHGCSVQDITSAAGLPKGSFYNHFESKQALAAEVARRYAAATDMSRLLSGSGSPVVRLRRHFEEQIARTTRTGLVHGCLLANFAAELADSDAQVILAEVSAGFEAWIGVVAQVVREAQEAGELPARQPPDVLARQLISGFEGAALFTKLTGDRRTYLDAFLEISFPIPSP